MRRRQLKLRERRACAVTIRPTRRAALVAGGILVLSAHSAHAQHRLRNEETRTAARTLREVRRIVSPRGVDTLEQVALGGVQQWISVRGRDVRNPILLFLHGGPGFPAMPSDYLWQGPWEEYFTVVQWDQRGAGKTFGANDSTLIAPTLTVDRMIADAEELVSLLRTRYHKRKIILVGHSWGTILGVELARRHPEWLHAYVGIAQVVDVRENERIGFEAIVDTARRAGDTVAVAQLRALVPYPGTSGVPPTSKLHIQRRWLTHFGGYTWRRPDDHYSDLVALSPDYSEADVRNFEPALSFSFEHLWPQFAARSIRGVTSLDCPVVLFHGTHDLTASTALVAQWYAHLHAPAKRLIWFAQSAHMVYMEEPGSVFLHLIHDVRPFAERAGDAAPSSGSADASP